MKAFASSNSRFLLIFLSLITISIPALSQGLSVVQSPYGCNLPGDSLSLEVCLLDSNGLPDSTANDTIIIEQASGPGTITGLDTLQLVNGCISFPNLQFSSKGTYSIRAFSQQDSIISPFIYIRDTCKNCPWLKRVLINACFQDEGDHEILFLNSGDFAIPVDSNQSSFAVSYGLNLLRDLTGKLVSDTGYVAALNGLAGCTPPLFIDALTNSPIPPNTNFIILSYKIDSVYDFSLYCTDGPIYVVFTADTDWHSNGNFLNASDTFLRYFQLDFASLPGGDSCILNYSYSSDTDLVSHTDGDGINFGSNGGSPISSWNNCQILGQNLLANLFGKAADNGQIKLQWEIQNTFGISGFRIFRKLDSEELPELIHEIYDNQEWLEAGSYQWLDKSPPRGGMEYEIEAIDVNGTSAGKLATWVYATSNGIQISTQPLERKLTFITDPEKGIRGELFSLAGKCLGAQSGRGKIVFQNLDTGLYIYKIQIGQDSYWGKTGIICE